MKPLVRLSDRKKHTRECVFCSDLTVGKKYVHMLYCHVLGCIVFIPPIFGGDRSCSFVLIQINCTCLIIILLDLVGIGII